MIDSGLGVDDVPIPDFIDLTGAGPMGKSPFFFDHQVNTGQMVLKSISMNVVEVRAFTAAIMRNKCFFFQ